MKMTGFGYRVELFRKLHVRVKDETEIIKLTVLISAWFWLA